MKDKIFQLLKQEYKSLGLGDEVLQAHGEMLDKMGLVTDCCGHTAHGDFCSLA